VGFPAARHAAQARGEAGVIKRPTVLCRMSICFVTPIRSLRTMSVLPPKVDIAAHWRMSALGQKRTSRQSLDDLVSAHEQG
jgi:hypothetical protein